MTALIAPTNRARKAPYRLPGNGILGSDELSSQAELELPGSLRLSSAHFPLFTPSQICEPSRTILRCCATFTARLGDDQHIRPASAKLERGATACTAASNIARATVRSVWAPWTLGWARLHSITLGILNQTLGSS
jgi:hypothetical protein